MTDQGSLKEALEEAVAKERFDMHALSLKAISALGGSSASKRYFNIATHLSQKVSNYVLDSLLRASFLIEIVKTPKIETTKMEVHWTNRLDNGDPRYASYEDCLQKRRRKAPKRSWRTKMALSILWHFSNSPENQLTTCPRYSIVITQPKKLLTKLGRVEKCGSGSVVERFLAKEDVAGSNPVSRSHF